MAKFERRLSLASLDKWIKELEIKEKNYPKVALRIADRMADEMLKEVSDKKAYKETYKMPSKLEKNTAIAGIKNDELKAYFNEFGTGIVGSQNQHISEELGKIGYKYDVNEHGEKGWVYPKEDGTFGWTKGLPARKEFWNVLQKIADRFPEIGKEELEREAKR